MLDGGQFGPLSDSKKFASVHPEPESGFWIGSAASEILSGGETRRRRLAERLATRSKYDQAMRLCSIVVTSQLSPVPAAALFGRGDRPCARSAGLWFFGPFAAFLPPLSGFVSRHSRKAATRTR